MKRPSRRQVLQATGTLGAVSLAGCGGNQTTTTTGGGAESIRAAWVTDTPVGDLGWSWAHDQGRQAVEAELENVETTIQEEVPPADAKQVMENLVDQGWDIIFGNAFGYMDAMKTLSQQHDDVAFEHTTGTTYNDNMGLYFGRQYQSRYLLGKAAGLLDDVDTVGYVGAFPLPEVVRGINAFTLGARSVDEDLTTKVRWVNSWFDPPKETEAAKSLIDAGADLMAQHQDSPSALKAAANADIWASGYQAPMENFAGDNYLSSAIWDWGEFYVPTVQELRNGEWSGDFEWLGLNSGLVAVDEFGPEVPTEVVDEVESTQASIEAGDLAVWEGTKFEEETDWWKYAKMQEFVEGVDGTIPS
jgi:basic membrane protein A